MRSLRSLISWRGPRKRKILLPSLDGNRMSRNGALALGADHLTGPVGTADGLAVAPVLIRRQTRLGIINIWLIFMVTLGAVIAVADGLTRAPNPEWELPSQGPLEYEPYYAAFLLAAVTLPLMLAYAKRARASITEGLFLWFAFCTAAYMKDFSYLRWPGAPLFVTDVILVVLLLSIYLLSRPHHSRSPLELNIFLLLFVAAGLLSAARGFWEHRDTILVLRDSALIAYALFLLVGYHLFRSWLSIKRVAVWFLLGTSLSALNGLAWFVVAPEQRRFIAPGIYILISLVATVLATVNGRLRPRAGWVFVGLLCFGLMLANARSLFVTLGIMLLIGLLYGRTADGQGRLGRTPATLLMPTILIILASSLFLHTQSGRDFTQRSTEELDSGVLHSGEDPNWQFRVAAWKEAWRRFEEYPSAGEGFGIPFVFGIWDNDPRPHNTFLTVLYKMGLIGFIPLLAFLCYFFWLSSRAVYRNRKNHHTLFLLIAVMGQMAFCLYGMANFVLESPFLASLFWASMGVGLRMIRILDVEQSRRWDFSVGTRHP